ncbi:MAG TPA: hypothetical protein VK066_27260 [Chloroflexota bacterium]|nr:hypothetical protein [Chloroflexota bacterium]
MMATTFEVWDLDSRNVLAVYETEAAALSAVARAVKHHGPDYATSLALMREDARGRSRLVAQGAALLERANAVGDPISSAENRATA